MLLFCLALLDLRVLLPKSSLVHVLPELKLLEDHLLAFQVAIWNLNTIGTHYPWHFVWLLQLPELRLGGSGQPYVDLGVVCLSTHWLLSRVEMHLVLYLTAVEHCSLV